MDDPDLNIGSNRDHSYVSPQDWHGPHRLEVDC